MFMDLVYDKFEKSIEIVSGVFLICSITTNYEYMIDCECIYGDFYFYRVIWNIDNGFNTKESINSQLEDIVRYLKSIIEPLYVKNLLK